MMVYLDVASSNRAQPNENFARELLELFMLGEGVRYTEDDIREAAKAFTGYRISRQTQSFRFDKKQFDSSEKAFFGRRGKFDGDAVINIVLDQPECAEFIVGKLWKFLASDAPPPPQVLADLSSRFRSSGFEVPAVLEELFLSEAFYAPDVVGRQVKSPVQWLVQSSKMLEVPLPPPEVLDVAFLQMGQVPFAPPNVKGWEGGRTWISSSTLLFRCNLAGYLIRGNTRGLGVSQEVPRVSGMDLDRIAPPELRSDPALLCGQLVRRLLPVPPSAAEQQRFLAFLEEGGQPVSDAVIYDLLHVMMSTPEFQLT